VIETPSVRVRELVRVRLNAENPAGLTNFFVSVLGSKPNQGLEAARQIMIPTL
jgi:hypothetical protein